jgi:PKD repeat protein
MIFNGAILHQSSTKNDAWLVKTDSCGYTEGDVSIAQVQLQSQEDSTVQLYNSSPQYCKWQWYFGNGDSSSVRHPQYTYSDTGTYTIMLITQAGNDKDTAYLTIHIGDTVVSSPQITIIQPQLKLYPNPATQYIILSGFIPQETGSAVLEFYDMQGKVIKQEPLEQGAINRSIGIKEFSQGVYAYKVFSNEKIIATGRIFIEP